MPLTLDTTKTVDVAKKEAGSKLILDLKKVGMTRMDAKSRVVLFLDISGSAEELYKKMLMHAITTRVGGIALNLDDNGDLDVYAFGSRVHKLPGFTVKNADTYVKKYVAPLVGEGTDYAPSFRTLKNDYGPGDPVFAIFITDGQNFDQADAIQALVELSYHGPVFIQTVGVGLNLREKFTNLQELNELGVVDAPKASDRGPRFIDNAGFCTIDFKNATEDDVYAALLNEYPGFLKKCKDKGYLPWTKSPLANVPGGSKGPGFLKSLFG